MSMIQVLCKKRFRFKNPNLSMIKNEQLADGKTTIQTENSGAKFEDVYREVTPNVLTAVPDWVKTDPIWGWGVKDGDILEVATVSPAQAEGQMQKSDADRAADVAAKDEQNAEKKQKLDGMTKVELLKYASDQHELELSPSMTKDTILAAINEAEADAVVS